MVLSWGEIMTVDKKMDLLIKPAVPKGSGERRDNCFLRRKLALVNFPPQQNYELLEILSRAVSRFDDVPHRLVKGKYFYGPFGAFDPNWREKIAVDKVLLNDGQNVGGYDSSTTPDLVSSITSQANKLINSGFARKLIDLRYSNKLIDPGYSNKLIDSSYSKKLIDSSYSKKLIDSGYSNKRLDSGSRKLIDSSHSETKSLPEKPDASNRVTCESQNATFQSQSEENDLNLPSHPNRPNSPRLPPFQRSSSRSNIHESSIFSKTDNSFVHYKLLDYAKLTILAIKGPWYKFSEQGMYHILYPKFFANIESDDWSPKVSYIGDVFKTDNDKNIIVTSLLAKATLAISAKHLPFIKVVHPNCCWDTLVVPKIRELLFELICEEYPKTGNWDLFVFDREAEIVPFETMLNNIKFCILCMVLSLGRFHSWQSQSPVKNPVDSYLVSEDLKASIELRKVAINFLNYHLDEYDFRNEGSYSGWYENYFLMALILQIHLDNSFGVYENFDLIYAVGEYLAGLNVDDEQERSSGTNGNQSPLEHYLRDVFKFFYIYYTSTQSVNSFNFSIPKKDQQQNYRDVEGDYDLFSGSLSDEESANDEENNASDNPLSAIKHNATIHTKDLSVTVHFNENSKSSDDLHEHFILKTKTERTKTEDKLEVGPVQNSVTGPIVPRSDYPDAYVSLGLPQALVRLFQDVVKLTNEKRIFKLKGVSPRNYPRICAETLDRVNSWRIEHHWKLYDIKFDATTGRETKMFLSNFHQGLNYNVECFYHALKIYFDRLITEVPIAQCQENIRKSLAAMENLSKLNAVLSKTSEGISFTCSFWPLLVCGSDIDFATNIQLRAQCEMMWKDQSFLTYNFWRSKQILFEIWNRQEHDGEYNGFMDMVREWDVVLNI